MYSHESLIRVRYAETDAMGVVHHSSYIVWFELARTDWLEARGYSYAEFEATGYYLVVTEIGARYLRPARYGHDVIVRATLTEPRSRGLRYDYEVRHGGTQEVLITGFSRHILTDHQGNIRKFPAYMWETLQGPKET
ncbi:MAG: acyl-CoA thioesterase [Ardenticatenales bacterium]|nr:acyl-CoA thioesterase [Ardenticatenales bacterium]